MAMAQIHDAAIFVLLGIRWPFLAMFNFFGSCVHQFDSLIAQVEVARDFPQ